MLGELSQNVFLRIQSFIETRVVDILEDGLVKQNTTLYCSQVFDMVSSFCYVTSFLSWRY